VFGNWGQNKDLRRVAGSASAVKYELFIFPEPLKHEL